ncbi:MAG: ABC transporter permease [Candidatus Nanopelagicales bacterium]
MPNKKTATKTPDDIGAIEAGLDALDTPVEDSTRSPAKRILSSLYPPVLAIVVLLVIWWVAYWLKLQPPHLLPSPLDVWGTFTKLLTNGAVWEAVTKSLQRAFLGFAISVVLGTLLGLALAQFTLFRRAFGPLITGLQILPSIAWVPAAILWFGIRTEAMLFVVILGATPSIANGLASGIAQMPSIYPRVGKMLGATGFDAIRFVILPAALPGYIAGLRQGWAFAWRSLMAAELIAYAPALGIGLGQVLQQGRELVDMPMVMTAIILILFVGILVELCIFAPLERYVLKQRGLAGAKR